MDDDYKTRTIGDAAYPGKVLRDGSWDIPNSKPSMPFAQFVKIIQSLFIGTEASVDVHRAEIVLEKEGVQFTVELE